MRQAVEIAAVSTRDRRDMNGIIRGAWSGAFLIIVLGVAFGQILASCATPNGGNDGGDVSTVEDRSGGPRGSH
jgi:hypothetical protein